jgi:hypothetical protein
VYLQSGVASEALTDLFNKPHLLRVRTHLAAMEMGEMSRRQRMAYDHTIFAFIKKMLKFQDTFTFREDSDTDEKEEMTASNGERLPTQGEELSTMSGFGFTINSQGVLNFLEPPGPVNPVVFGPIPPAPLPPPITKIQVTIVLPKTKTPDHAVLNPKCRVTPFFLNKVPESFKSTTWRMLMLQLRAGTRINDTRRYPRILKNRYATLRKHLPVDYIHKPIPPPCPPVADKDVALIEATCLSAVEPISFDVVGELYDDYIMTRKLSDWSPTAKGWMSNICTKISNIPVVGTVCRAANAMYNYTEHVSVTFEESDFTMYADSRSDALSGRSIKHKCPMITKAVYTRTNVGTTFSSTIFTHNLFISKELLAQICNPRIMQLGRDRAVVLEALNRAAQSCSTVNIDRHAIWQGRNIYQDTVLIATLKFDEMTWHNRHVLATVGAGFHP